MIRLKLYLLPPFLVELEVKCTKDAIQVYLNGYLQFSSTKLHDLGEIPDIKEIRVSKIDGNQNVGPMLSFTYGEFIPFSALKANFRGWVYLTNQPNQPNQPNHMA